MGPYTLSSAEAPHGKLNILETTSLQSKQHERGLCRGERALYIHMLKEKSYKARLQTMGKM